MYVYQPGQNGDAELLAWYLRLLEDGDLVKLYGEQLQPLSSFVQHYTGPDSNLVYDADDKGWWIVGWFKPFMGGYSWGLWVRPDRRDTVEGVDFTFRLHEMAFEQTPLLMLSTTQTAVVSQMESLGYVNLGAVPGLFGDANPGYVMYLTRDAFAGTQELWKDKAHGRSSR